MCERCGTLAGNDLLIGVKDNYGCILPRNHIGDHEFIDDCGNHWLWSTDWDCDCENCQNSDGTYCISYGPKVELLEPQRHSSSQRSMRPEMDTRQMHLF